jgi:hypothetical protein
MEARPSLLEADQSYLYENSSATKRSAGPSDRLAIPQVSSNLLTHTNARVAVEFCPRGRHRRCRIESKGLPSNANTADPALTLTQGKVADD